MNPVITREQIESLGLHFEQAEHDSNNSWDTYSSYENMYHTFVFSRNYAGYVSIVKENSNNGNIDRIGFRIKSFEDFKKLYELCILNFE